MVTKTAINKEIAMRMWDKIKQSPFCNIPKVKNEMAKTFHVNWLEDCLLCELFRRDFLAKGTAECENCPLFEESGFCGSVLNPYHKLFLLRRKYKKYVKKWEKSCNRIIEAIGKVDNRVMNQTSSTAGKTT